MRRRAREIALLSIVAALMTFAVVQDRVTAAGARRYVALQRDALATGRPPVTIDEVVTPTVRESIQQGLLWGSVVLVCGLALAAFAGRRSANE